MRFTQDEPAHGPKFRDDFSASDSGSVSGDSCEESSASVDDRASLVEDSQTLCAELDAAFELIQSLPVSPAPILPRIAERQATLTAPMPAQPSPDQPTALIAVSMNVGDRGDSARVISLHELASADEPPGSEHDALVDPAQQDDKLTASVISLDHLVPKTVAHRGRRARAPVLPHAHDGDTPVFGGGPQTMDELRPLPPLPERMRSSWETGPWRGPLPRSHSDSDVDDDEDAYEPAQSRPSNPQLALLPAAKPRVTWQERRRRWKRSVSRLFGLA